MIFCRRSACLDGQLVKEALLLASVLQCCNTGCSNSLRAAGSAVFIQFAYSLTIGDRVSQVSRSARGHLVVRLWKLHRCCVCRCALRLGPSTVLQTPQGCNVVCHAQPLYVLHSYMNVIWRQAAPENVRRGVSRFSFVTTHETLHASFCKALGG